MIGRVQIKRHSNTARVWRSGDRTWRVLATLYLGALLSANAMAAKLINVFGFAAVTVGALAIPLIYTVTDLLNELYGKTVTRQVVWMGLGANLVMVAYSLVFGALPAAPAGASQEAFGAMFAVTWRVVLGSQCAYVTSSLIDVEVFSYVRERTRDRHLWLRQTCAVLVSQAADSTIFTIIAFAGVVPWQLLPVLALTEYLVKVVVTPVRTALSYAILERLRR